MTAEDARRLMANVETLMAQFQQIQNVFPRLQQMEAQHAALNTQQSQLAAQMAAVPGRDSGNHERRREELEEKHFSNCPKFSGVLSEWDLRMPEERKLCVDLADHCSAEAASDPAVAPPGAPCHRFSLNSPGTHLAATSCGASAPVVRLADGAVVGLLEGHSDRVTAVAWSPAADRVLTGSRDRSLCTHKVVA